jgi:predicted methyltransferase MtxX (methanogen marker protein 4)
MWKKYIKTWIDGRIMEQISGFIYSGNINSELKKNIDMKLQRHNKINGIIKRNSDT